MQELPNWIVALISAILGFLASIVGTIILDRRRDRGIREAVEESLILELEGARKILAGIIKEKRKDTQIIELDPKSPHGKHLPLVDYFFSTLGSELAIRALKPKELRVVLHTYGVIRLFNTKTFPRTGRLVILLPVELTERLAKQISKCIIALEK